MSLLLPNIKRACGNGFARHGGRVGDHRAAVLTLITEFGGCKTLALTVLYHLANTGGDAANLPDMTDLMEAVHVTQ